MSNSKHIDADRLIRRYYEDEDTGQQGAFPENTLASVPHVDPHSSGERMPDATLSGGDVDATWSGTDDGEEAVGGSTPTPDQDVVDKLGEAVGITYEDAEPLRFGDKVADRDAQRWELNPASSEGYQERLREISDPGTSTPTNPQTKRPKQAARTKQSAPSRHTVGNRKGQKKSR